MGISPDKRSTRIVEVAGTVSISKTIKWVKGEFIQGATKTSSSRRTITLPLDIIDELLAAKKHELVFPREDGGYLHLGTLRKDFNKVIRKAGIPRIRLHDLRHLNATMLIGSGTNLKVVSSRLGHSNVSITAKVYAHVTPQMDRDATNLLADRLGLR
ncbi:MAG TPA: site-specific integrase [bacterium]|nr:site-specific integrase [bacterium]